MRRPEKLKAQLSATIASLPLQSLQALAEFAEFLRSKGPATPAKHQPKLLALGGMARTAVPMTDQEIDDARREMWEGFGDREL